MSSFKVPSREKQHLTFHFRAYGASLSHTQKWLHLWFSPCIHLLWSCSDYALTACQPYAWHSTVHFTVLYEINTSFSNRHKSHRWHILDWKCLSSINCLHPWCQHTLLLFIWCIETMNFSSSGTSAELHLHHVNWAHCHVWQLVPKWHGCYCHLYHELAFVQDFGLIIKILISLLLFCA